MLTKSHSGRNLSLIAKIFLAVLAISALLLSVHDRISRFIWWRGETQQLHLQSSDIPLSPDFLVQELSQERNDGRDNTDLFVSRAPIPTSLDDQAALWRSASEPADSHESISTKFSFERALESDEGMTSEDVDSLIEDRETPGLIDRFALESSKDRDAEALSRIFRSVVERSIVEAGLSMRLAGFACGTQVCLGTMEDGNIFDYVSWRDQFALAPELSGVVVRAVTISEANGDQIMRFSFFVDPAREPRAPGL